MPLPQYIEKARKHSGLSPSIATDKERYQTVYAKYNGSIAAPTAGFHFTPELLQKLKDKGVNIAYITLHVGWGTFKPLRGEPQQHHMLAELGEISPETAEIVNATHAQGKRVFPLAPPAPARWKVSRTKTAIHPPARNGRICLFTPDTSLRPLIA